MRHHHHNQRHACEECRQKRALYCHCGVVRADRHHTICFRCFRSLMDRQRASVLREAAPNGVALAS